MTLSVVYAGALYSKSLSRKLIWGGWGWGSDMSSNSERIMDADDASSYVGSSSVGIRSKYELSEILSLADIGLQCAELQTIRNCYFS